MAVPNATEVDLLNRMSGLGNLLGKAGDRLQKMNDTGDLVGSVDATGNGESLKGPLTGNVIGKVAAPASTVIIDFSLAVPDVEVTGSLITTKGNWITHTAAGAAAVKLLTSTSATTGLYSALRIRARSDVAVADDATIQVYGGDFSASANHAQYANLVGCQGVAQPNAFGQTNAGNIICGLYARTDLLANGSSGRDWPLWVDTHMAAKAAGGSYLARLSHNGTVANDGCFTIYNGGRMPVLFNFEDLAGFLSASASGTFTKTHKIAVNIPGVGVKYIEAGDIA